jgi:ABC-type multidrug transport system fused ATPase/permease subunit
VVEVGRHEELLARAGAYARLVQVQVEQTPENKATALAG